MYQIKLKKVPFVFGLVCFSGFINAQVVDLPSITETPDLERETLLKDLDIPPVRDRDPDPEAGPRLSVSEFRLQGIVEYPDLGITREAISKIVEDIRFDLMAEGKLLESGHTLEELGEISSLLSDIEKEVDDQHVGPIEVQRLVWLVREQQLKRGITLGMIETVADRITRYYRERGFILAKAYIPEQKVRDGVVNLTLLLGVLGEVKVNGSELYQDEILISAFDDMLTEPVTSSAVEERLYLINDLPGVSSQGFFESGSQVGDTRLNVNVKSQESYNVNLRVDNHGTDETGKNRLYSELLWNNPTGTADQLYLGVLYSTNTVYGQLRYGTNIAGTRLKFAAGYANNAFVLRDGDSQSINDLGLSGETNVFDIVASYKFKRSRKKNYSFDVVFESIESLITLARLADDSQGVLDDEVQNLSFVFNFDILQESSQMLHEGNFRVVFGDFVLGADAAQDQNYAIFRANYSLLSFWKIPFTDIETRSVIRSSVQWSDSALSTINQFSLGGPAKSRAYEAKEFTGDVAYFVGFDWFFNAPDFMSLEIGETSLTEIVTPFLFIDAAYGRSKSLTTDGEVNESVLMNGGIGIQFAYANNLTGSLQVAVPLDGWVTSFYSGPSSAVHETKVWFEAQYRF